MNYFCTNLANIIMLVCQVVYACHYVFTLHIDLITSLAKEVMLSVVLVCLSVNNQRFCEEGVSLSLSKLRNFLITQQLFGVLKFV